MSQIMTNQPTQGASIGANQQKNLVKNDLRQMPEPPKTRGFWPMIIFSFVIMMAITLAIGFKIGHAKGFAEGRETGYIEGKKVGCAEGKAEAEIYYASSNGILHKSSCIYYKRKESRNCKVCGGRDK